MNNNIRNIEENNGKKSYNIQGSYAVIKSHKSDK